MEKVGDSGFTLLLHDLKVLCHVGFSLKISSIVCFTSISYPSVLGGALEQAV